MKNPEQQIVREGIHREPVVEKENAVSFLGVEIKKGTEDSPRVPKVERFKKDVVTAFDLRLMRDLAVGISLNQPILVQGGSGVGKSRTIDRMAAMTHRPSYYANCHELDPDVLIGKLAPIEDAKSGFGWRDGLVVEAVRKGGWLVLDEYNFMKGTTRAALHEVLDAILQGKDSITLVDNHGEQVPVHPDFRIVAAQNPPGGQHGDREQLDPAQYTRFSHIVLPEDLPKEVKKARLLGSFGKDNVISLDEKEYFVSGSIDRQALAEIPGFEDLMDKYLEFTDSLQKSVDSGSLGKEAQGKQPVYFSFQRDTDRVLNFVQKFYDGDLGETLRTALRFYFAKRFESDADRAKIEEMILQITYVAPADARRKEPPAKNNVKKKAKKETPEKVPETDVEKVLEEMDKETKELKATARKLRRELRGETAVEPVISGTWRYKDASGSEKEKLIELNLETNIERWSTLYKKHGIELPSDFEQIMEEIWDKNREEIVEAIESRGYNDLVLVPAGLTSVSLNSLMTKGYKTETYEGVPVSGITEDTTKAHVRLLHNAHNLSDHPVLKETCGKKNDSYGAEGSMTLADYLIYQRQYFEATGKHLDDKTWTWLPGSKSGSRIVDAGWDPDVGQLYVNAGAPGGASGDFGCRLSRSFSTPEK